MSTIEHASELPAWAALLVSFFLVVGAGLTLIGTIGFVRLPTFYERIHAPTLGTSWGTGGIVMASMIFFTVLATRPVVHEILIGIFAGHAHAARPCGVASRPNRGKSGRSSRRARPAAGRERGRQVIFRL
jgi:monovalent cation/proton antiporter MnhG/PhaG subunit